MALRFTHFGELASQYKNALQAFKASGATFQLLKTVQPSSASPSDPKRLPPDESPRTLFVLDSSFNPPTIAHGTLVRSVLAKNCAERYAGPYRLLLLFSTMNADKAPSAASFHQRLAMMTVFAKDILNDLARDKSGHHLIVPIDVGVTTAPYYTDKSKAIETEGAQWYPDKPKHVHLVGFDTLTRFFTAKYYSEFKPPFSALKPYFDEGGHRLRVMLRPDDSYGSIDTQQAFLDKLSSGEMESEGGKREWAKQVELIPPNPEAGVSSTKVRRAAKAQTWSEVQRLCTPGVAEWMQAEALYKSDDAGAKTAYM